MNTSQHFEYLKNFTPELITVVSILTATFILIGYYLYSTNPHPAYNKNKIIMSTFMSFIITFLLMGIIFLASNIHYTDKIRGQYITDLQKRYNITIINSNNIKMDKDFGKDTLFDAKINTTNKIEKCFIRYKNIKTPILNFGRDFDATVYCNDGTSKYYIAIPALIK